MRLRGFSAEFLLVTLVIRASFLNLPALSLDPITSLFHLHAARKPQKQKDTLIPAQGLAGEWLKQATVCINTN